FALPTPYCSLVVYFLSLLNPPPTTELYTLSLHDALPISRTCPRGRWPPRTSARTPGTAASRRAARRPSAPGARRRTTRPRRAPGDRKSTRLNSSHLGISYAVFCLKKKTKKKTQIKNI